MGCKNWNHFDSSWDFCNLLVLRDEDGGFNLERGSRDDPVNMQH